jgi:hypothetical protein
VYDMYPWNDRPDAGPAGAGPAQARAAEAGAAAEATQAIQVALDRRDNGGDAVAAVSPTTPGRTRQ